MSAVPRAVGPYRVELLDRDGCELTITEENTFREARRAANEKVLEPGYHDWQVARVLDATGVVVYDRHRV